MEDPDDSDDVLENRVGDDGPFPVARRAESGTDVVASETSRRLMMAASDLLESVATRTVALPPNAAICLRVATEATPVPLLADSLVPL